MNVNNKLISLIRYSLVKDCINNIEIINIWIFVIFFNRALIFIIDRGLYFFIDFILLELESKDFIKIK